MRSTLLPRVAADDAPDVAPLTTRSDALGRTEGIHWNCVSGRARDNAVWIAVGRAQGGVVTWGPPTSANARAAHPLAARRWRHWSGRVQQASTLDTMSSAVAVLGGAARRGRATRGAGRVALWGVLAVALAAALACAASGGAGLPVAAASAGSDAAKPRDPKKLGNAADRAFRQKDYDEALRLYAEAIHASPDLDSIADPQEREKAAKKRAKLHYSAFKAHTKQQKFHNALSDLNEALAVDPGLLVALLQRANLLLTTGDCTAAVKDYQAVLAADASKKDAIKRLPEAQACARAIAAAASAERGRQWQVCVDRTSDAMADGRAVQSVPLLMQRARCYVMIGRHHEALADTGKVLKIDKGNMAAYELRGNTFFRLMDFDMAKTHYQEGLKSDPEHKGCKEAYRLVKQVVKIKGRADDHQAKSQHHDALAAFEELLKLTPDHNEFVQVIHKRMAQSYVRIKRAKEAVASAQKAVDMNDQDADAHRWMGEALLILEEWEPAVRAFKRANEINKGDRELQDGLARAEAALKQSKVKNYYKILGVARDADERTIKKAYRRLALELHPDKQTDETRESAEQKFLDVAEAYEILTDAEKRQRYDRGEDVLNNQGGGPPRGHHPFQHGPGGQRFHFKFG